MASKLGWVIGLSFGLLPVSNAIADLDVCDSLGLSGLTISADNNCLRIEGGVNYDFDFGERPNCPTPATNCGGSSLDFGNGMMLSGFRLTTEGGLTFSAPSPLGLLETGSPTVTTPAYDTDVYYSGFKVGVGLDARLHTDWFTPMDLGVDLSFGQLTGKGNGGSVDFTDGLGVPSVGLIDGAWAPGNQWVSDTDILINRTFGTLDKSAKIPLFGGQHQFGMHDTVYTGYGIVGSRFGMLRETQDIDIVTSQGTVTYDTTLNGGFGGMYLGLGIDKAMLLPNSDLILAMSFFLTGGFDYHHYSITDSVGGTFAAPSTNTFTSSDTVPTVRIGGDVSVGKNGFQAGIGGSVNWGVDPALHVIRPISNVNTTPYVDVTQLMSAEVHAGFRVRF
jgi:hypothetical protein